MSTIIVGGGIAGLISALYLSRSGKDVVIIEKDSSLGGLLNSRIHGDYVYEQGTHILQQLMDEEVNGFLFHNLENSTDWNKGNKLKVGVYFNGKLDYEGPCIDARYLDERTYNDGIVSMIDTMETELIYDNLEQQLNVTYGQVFGKEIYKSAVEKLFGVSSNKLIPDAHTIFMAPRIKLFTQEATTELKKLKFFDDRIAHHENQSESPWYYSKKHGVKHWIESIVHELIERNTLIYTNEMIDRIDKNKNRIMSIHLKNRDINLNCEHLIWTAPAGLLAPTLGYKLTKKPEIRKIKLFHLKFDREFQIIKDVHYIVNYDSKLHSFRITFYGSLTGDENSRCTVEVLYTDEITVDTTTIVKELIEMGLVSKQTKLIESYEENIIQGFPILSHGFVTEQKYIIEKIEENWDNITLLGRKVGQSFFMKDVMSEAYHKSKRLVSSM